MIDLHCHIDLYPQPEVIAAECSRRGMHVLSVTNTPSAWIKSNTLADGDERIRTALGLHPQLARQRKGELPQFDELIHEVQFVGEVGLDGAADCKPFWDDQVAVLEHVLSTCAREGGRILSIHSRRAANDVLDLLERHPAAGTPILHWFSGSLGSLERAIHLDCWYSVGPAMLRSRSGRELAMRMPTGRVLTETDGPFVMVRDRSILPWEVADVTRQLSEIWSLSEGETEARLTSNLRRLVGSCQ